MTFLESIPEYRTAVARVTAANAIATPIAEAVAAGTEAHHVTEALVLISDLNKQVEADRKAALKGREEDLTAIRHGFKEIMAPVAAVEEALKDYLKKKNQEEAEAAAEAQAKLDEAAAEAQEEEEELAAAEEREPEVIQAPTIAPPSTTRRTKTGSASGSKIRKYRILDFSKLPDKYKQPAKGELNSAVKGGIDSIPGVEIYFDENIQVNS